jgi:hypothetical protein
MNHLALVKWAFQVVPLIVDPGQHHFAARQLPQEAADAFVTACETDNLFDTDPTGRLCVGFDLVMSALESGFSLFPHGLNDHGRAAGPFQEHYGAEQRTVSWLVSTRHYHHTVKNVAFVSCPEQPIAALAGERCGESPKHNERWAQIKTLMSVALPESLTSSP